MWYTMRYGTTMYMYFIKKDSFTKVSKASAHGLPNFRKRKKCCTHARICATFQYSTVTRTPTPLKLRNPVSAPESDLNDWTLGEMSFPFRTLPLHGCYMNWEPTLRSCDPS